MQDDAERGRDRHSDRRTAATPVVRKRVRPCRPRRARTGSAAESSTGATRATAAAQRRRSAARR